jgi:Xaa-Pro dipeptidase
MPMPELRRRDFALGALAAGAALAARPARLLAAADPPLRDMTGDVAPIGAAERLGRIEKARGLMRRHGLGAILVEPGASLDYFTGVQWWRSERLTAALIPAEGEPIVFTPFFEEPSVRESLGIRAEVSPAGRSASRRPCASSPSTGSARRCRESTSAAPPRWCAAAG